MKLKVFYGASQTKMSTTLAAAIQPLGSDAEYIAIDGSGRNALDFHITYYIGRLSSEDPNAIFHIVSKDTGYDPLIRHLKTKGITCHRLQSLASTPVVAAAPPPAGRPDRVQKIAESLLGRKEARPRRRKTLTAFITAQLRPQGTEAQLGAVMDRLTKGGMSILPDDKVTWPSA